MKRAGLNNALRAAAATALLVTSCAQLPEAGRIKTPMVTLTDVRYREVSVVGLTMETDLLIENPNAFPVSIAYLNYSLSLDGVKFGYGSRAKRLTVKPYSDKKLTVPIRLAFIDMVGSAVSSIHKRSGNYSIEGEIVLRAAGGDEPRSFRKEGTINFTRM